MGGARGTSTATGSRWPGPGFFTDPELGTTLVTLPAIYITGANFVAGLLNTRNALDVNFSTYAPQTAEEISAISKMSARGRTENTTIKKGKKHLVEVIDGTFLDGSLSDFQDAVSKIKTQARDVFNSNVIPGIGATLYLIGDPAPDNLAQSIASDVTSRLEPRTEAALFKVNYDAERKRQIHVLGYGVVYSAQDMLDAELLRRSGLYTREYNQGKLEDTWNRTEGRYLTEIRRLEVLGNALRSMIGTQEAQTSQYYKPNPLVGVAGGAMTGAMIGSVIPGAGTAAGAAVGSVVGLLASL